jgi:hypothetical protein
MTDPAPLRPVEIDRIRHWQRAMLIYYGAAMTALVLVGGLTLMYMDVAWLRRSALGLVLMLVAGATLVQFRARCPRCGLRLGAQARLFLPDKCRRCGVDFGSIRHS